MGNTQKERDELLQCMNEKYIPKYVKSHRSLREDEFNVFSIIAQDDKDRVKFQNVFKKIKEEKVYEPKLLALSSVQEQRCIASFLGLAICDALGASTEFQPYIKTGYALIFEGFNDIENAIDEGLLDSRAGKIGIWTDDCSMALCIADSLIYNHFTFQPKHIRYLFLLWFFNGLNNGGRQHSIGLGGNIKISMGQFMKNQDKYCELGDQFNNGNGSLMRLAPIPILYRNNEKQAMTLSQQSSRTTHNGLQAKQCCRLLSFILTSLYKNPSQDRKKVLSDACDNFQTVCLSVKCLALSTVQFEDSYVDSINRYGNKFKMWNRSIEDRNWSWKEESFTYSPTRAKLQPGYVGSYCMDALAMALHTVWFTSSFKEVAMMNANMGGDCDTVGAIAGQIAGAMYGIDKEMLRLYSEMVDFKSGRYEVFLKAYKLTNGGPK